MKLSLPTTVFVIDDDSAVLNRVTKESLRNTNLGVLTAQDLPTAVDYLDKEYPVGAVLADLHFRPETQCEKRKMHDGLDFLDYVRKRHPRVPLYVFSIDADDRSHHRRAEQMKIRVRGWYDKLRKEAATFDPWVRIERDLIMQALKTEPAFREKAEAAGENPADLLADEDVAEKVRTVFNYPRLTFLQRLPEACGLRFKEPLAVHCWPGEGKTFVARAVRLPLLLDGCGDDPVEAIDNLADLILDERAALEREGSARLTGYARFIKEGLDACLEPSDS